MPAFAAFMPGCGNRNTRVEAYRVGVRLSRSFTAGNACGVRMWRSVEAEGASVQARRRRRVFLRDPRGSWTREAGCPVFLAGYGGFERDEDCFQCCFIAYRDLFRGSLGEGASHLASEPTGPVSFGRSVCFVPEIFVRSVSEPVPLIEKQRAG